MITSRAIRWAKARLRQGRGASGIEYGLLVGLLAVGIIAAVGQTGNGIADVLCIVTSDLANVVGGISTSCGTLAQGGSGAAALTATPAALRLAAGGSQAVTVTNSGGPASNLSATFPTGSSFSAVPATCGIALAANSSCTYTVSVGTGITSVSDTLTVSATQATPAAVHASATSTICLQPVTTTLLNKTNTTDAAVTISYSMIGGGGGGFPSTGGTPESGSLSLGIGSTLNAYAGGGGGGEGYVPSTDTVPGYYPPGGGGVGWYGGGSACTTSGYAGGGGGGSSAIVVDIPPQQYWAAGGNGYGTNGPEMCGGGGGTNSGGAAGAVDGVSSGNPGALGLGGNPGSQGGAGGGYGLGGYPGVNVSGEGANATSYTVNSLTLPPQAGQSPTCQPSCSVGVSGNAGLVILRYPSSDTGACWLSP